MDSRPYNSVSGFSASRGQEIAYGGEYVQQRGVVLWVYGCEGPDLPNRLLDRQYLLGHLRGWIFIARGFDFGF